MDIAFYRELYEEVNVTNHEKTFLLCVIILAILSSCKKSINSPGDKKTTLDENITKNKIDVNLPIADVAILGIFHYASNVDSYKRKYHIDVTSEKTKRKLTIYYINTKTTNQQKFW